MRTFKSVLIAAAIALAGSASATPITFQTAPLGSGFTGPVTEHGFTYLTTSGLLFVNSYGNPGQDMEADGSSTGGSLVVFRQDGGTFKFDSIDFAAYDSGGTQPQFLSLVGVTKNNTIAQEFYTLNSTSVFNPTYDNWTTELPTVGGLAGLELKSLAIVLFSDPTGNLCYGAVDNVNLTDVPEPVSMMLFGAGLLGFAARRRARKTA